MDDSRNDWGKVCWAASFRILTFLERLGQGFWARIFRILTFLERMGQGFLGRIFQIFDFSGMPRLLVNFH